ncbi:gas vesicle protein GvpN [Algihabitans albus]|uniref:gas vesicle protein GvpN n=1 Tax=Algihabitans albus TaxID=2164067 RepID=UPI000E5D4EF3|nr:gas vesicle protein GvpN [Algihabitans albus]
MNAVGQAKAQLSSQRLQNQPKSGFVETDRLAELSNRIRAYLRASIPVHLRGPAGCGKTSIAMHVASSLGRPISMVVGDKNMTTADLVGAKSGYQTTRVVDNFVNSVTKVEENAIQGWQDHRLTVACREGHTFIYDEFNRSPASANNVFLGVLEERVLILPAHNKREEYLKVHPNFTLILTSNPLEYAGTHAVQDALADRMITIELDHQDRETEIDITLARSGVSRGLAERIVDFVRAYRSSGAYEQTPTMRASIMIAKIVEAGALELTMRDPLIEKICADVLQARCGGGKDAGLREARSNFMTELARHHFDGAPRPIFAGETARLSRPDDPSAGAAAPEITAIGGMA